MDGYERRLRLVGNKIDGALKSIWFWSVVYVNLRGY